MIFTIFFAYLGACVVAGGVGAHLGMFGPFPPYNRIGLTLLGMAYGALIGLTWPVLLLT